MKFNNRNVEIGSNVLIGKNVRIGDNTIIYDNVKIEDNSIICNNCIIGEPKNDYYFDNEYKNAITLIGKNSLIRSHTIIYCGSEFGEEFVTGHRVTIREKSVFGSHCLVGSYSDVQGNCEIGNYSRFHSYVNVGQKSKIGNYVFIYPFVVLTNDPNPPSEDLIGCIVGDYSQLCASSVILPGAIIQMHCLIGANSTVGGTFNEYSFINGSPAKYICDIRKLPVFSKVTGEKYYPWPQHFKRGMPWENGNIWKKK